MGKQHTLIAKGLSLSFLTLSSRILGLVREMTKAKFLGTSALGDAFGIAFQVPNFCRRLFAENSISVAFIPTFKNYLEDSSAEGKQRTQEFIRATFTLVSFLTAVFVALGMVFTPLILRIFFKSTTLVLVLPLRTTMSEPTLLLSEREREREREISHSVVSDSLRPHESQHARPPCPSPTP